jgi:hypothetical protein
MKIYRPNFRRLGNKRFIYLYLRTEEMFKGLNKISHKENGDGNSLF